MCCFYITKLHEKNRKMMNDKLFALFAVFIVSTYGTHSYPEIMFTYSTLTSKFWISVHTKSLYREYTLVMRDSLVFFFHIAKQFLTIFSWQFSFNDNQIINKTGELACWSTFLLIFTHDLSLLCIYTTWLTFSKLL